MFANLIEKLKEAIRKMVAYRNVEETIESTIYSSEKMEEHIDICKLIYTNQAPWLSEEVVSLNLGKEIAQSMQMMVLSEMESKINNNDFMNEQYQKNLIDKLPENLEKAMAVGGMIARPYISNNQIFFDFCLQGEFLPIAFDDDGTLYDVAFIKRIVSGNNYYTRIERQTFDAANKTITIETKAFVSKRADYVGDEIPLDTVDDWADITPVITINNTERPLFGFYKVPIANNIDLDSPLGISVFTPAINLIQKADEQFSRLDWEYEGGQMAVDVSEDALQNMEMDRFENRIYRKLNFDNIDTYEAFAPTLRDSNFINGLEKYLMRIEDVVGLARGSISEVSADARTATEIKILKQRTYITVKNHQEAIDKMLNGCVYAMNVLSNLYFEESKAEAELVTDWKDSVLTDTDAELEQRLRLLDAGIEGKAELRAWWKGEDLETAQQMVDEIAEQNGSELLNDIFTNRIPAGDNK